MNSMPENGRRVPSMKTDLAELPPKLRDYIDQSSVALAVSDARDDFPLVQVIDRFCRLTEYDRSDVLGRNCRFLQGDDTPAAQTQALHDFIRDDSASEGRFPIVNHRKSGDMFHNLVFMTRLRDAGGRTAFVLASQFDVTTAMLRAQADQQNGRLGRAVTDIDQIGREFGLAVMGSAKYVSESIAMMARMTFEDDNR